MKRTPLKRVGKIGKANIQARKIIAEIAQDNWMTECELKLGGCLLNMFLAPAHRNKRSWYKGNVDLLSDINQWVCACVNCHDQIENSRELTEKLFEKLRG